MLAPYAFTVPSSELKDARPEGCQTRGQLAEEGCSKQPQGIFNNLFFDVF